MESGAFATPAAAYHLPRWEFGLGAGALNLPAYRGAEGRKTVWLPVPYLAYTPETRLLGGAFVIFYHNLEAENGVRALEIWATRGAGIDLLLSDMVMPGGVSGLDLARQFQQEKPQLKVLLTSGYSDESLGIDFSAMDGIDFMSKPYHPDQLVRHVRSCLDLGRTATGPGA